jgi:hypothetical protein
VEIRFSLHAKNKVRLYRLIDKEVEEVVLSGVKFNQENKFESHRGDLRVIWLMVGAYALIVTVIKTERRGKW